MAPIDQVVYLAPIEYLQALDVLRKFTAHALHWLAKKTHEDLKDQIVGNFIARGTVCLDSICRLWASRELPRLLDTAPNSSRSIHSFENLGR